MNKRDKIIYYIATGLFSALMLFSASMYFIMHEEIALTFGLLQFPAFIIYPLAIAKILGLVAIWTEKSKWLKEWAYAGFTFNALLAIGAHLNIGDGEHMGGVMAIVLLTVSYIFYRRLEKQRAEA